MRNDLAESLLARSADYIEHGGRDPRLADPRGEELADFGNGLALVTSFSHVIALRGSRGLTLVDTSMEKFAERIGRSLREWSADPVATIIYTHGHLDHVGGARHFVEEARTTGAPAPTVIAHEAVGRRFRRYEVTDGYNARINARQFHWKPGDHFALDWVWPQVSYQTRLDVDLGGEQAELHHARGETDDHTWVWLPERQTVCGGDFLTWVFPNAGNPQKVQRYPLEWAGALRAMASKEPELFLPAHGLPIEGKERIRLVLHNIAEVLESLVAQTLDLMNAGATLNDVVHTVKVPDRYASLPYLSPVYDEPEFVLHNIWRLYGGWWDGDVATLKPASRASLAQEIAALAGGPQALAKRAADVCDQGDLRLAGHLIEFAVGAEGGGTPEIHDIRRAIYSRRRENETSLMARNIFRQAAETSTRIAEQAQ